MMFTIQCRWQILRIIVEYDNFKIHKKVIISLKRKEEETPISTHCTIFGGKKKKVIREIT